MPRSKAAGVAVSAPSTLTFGPGTVFVCPVVGARNQLEADEAKAVLFSFSDRPVQQALDLWREAFS